MNANQQNDDKGVESDSISRSERFPIRVLAEKTGVGSSTLRAWERRYGLLQPERTPKGHRLFSREDVNRVLKIVQLLQDGHSLPKLAALLDQDGGSSNIDAAGHKLAAEPSTVWKELQQATMEAVGDFSVERIDAIYDKASSLYPVDMLTERLVEPCLTVLGSRWQQRPERGIAEEHFYTSWLRNRLGSRFHQAYAQARGAKIVFACVPGSYHEIGLMLFALSAIARGYRILYFGADLPFDQLAHIVNRSAARAVVLGAHQEARLDTDMNTQLNLAVSALKVPVFLGGPDDLIDKPGFEQAGGILLGSSLSVALQVMERRVPPYATDHGH